MDIQTYIVCRKQATAYTDEKIASLGGGIQYKGSIAFADLPTPSSSNKGWMYTVTDKNNHEFLSDGAQWLDLNGDSYRVTIEV